MESKIEDLSFVREVRVRSSPRVVKDVEVHPRQTVSWRLERDAELRIVDESVWLTRHLDPYDYWLRSGDVVRLSRGEHVWIWSDGERAVEVSLTSQCKPAPAVRLDPSSLAARDQRRVALLTARRSENSPRR